MMDISYRGEYRAELEAALDAARWAAKVILEFHGNHSVATYVKVDGSPVTDADLAADRVIRQILATAFPEDALLTEEGAADQDRLRRARCWIVDPIDGTAQFLKGTGLFDVMIALCVEGRPVVAVGIQPVRHRIHAAVDGAGAWVIGDRQQRFVIGKPQVPPRIVTSKWYGGGEAERGAAVRRIAGRLGAAEPPSLEVGFQARNFADDERSFDAFIGLPAGDKGSIAQEWDLACVDLTTHEAGGSLTDCWGRRHRYNKRSTGISGGILASSSPELHRTLLAAIRPELPAEVPALDPADDGVSERWPEL